MSFQLYYFISYQIYFLVERKKIVLLEYRDDILLFSFVHNWIIVYAFWSMLSISSGTPIHKFLKKSILAFNLLKIVWTLFWQYKFLNFGYPLIYKSAKNTIIYIKVILSRISILKNLVYAYGNIFLFMSQI